MCVSGYDVLVCVVCVRQNSGCVFPGSPVGTYVPCSQVRLWWVPCLESSSPKSVGVYDFMLCLFSVRLSVSCGCQVAIGWGRCALWSDEGRMCLDDCVYCVCTCVACGEVMAYLSIPCYGHEACALKTGKGLLFLV